MENTYAKRVKSLQKLMSAQNLRAFIVPSNDIHSNEYLPECFKDRAFMSGFNGSAGTLLLMQSEGRHSAHLFTDGRYKIQAKIELKGSGIALENSANYEEFLQNALKSGALKKGDFIGVNPKALSMSAHKRLKKSLKGVKICLVDLVSEIWKRPPLPKEAIFAQEKRFVGASVGEKLKAIRAKMREAGAEWHFISALDDIAWITNLRGSDVAHNPVFMAFLLISKENATLFTRHKIDKKIAQNLPNFKIEKYECVEAFLRKIKGAKILLDAQKTSIYIAKIFKANGNKIIRATNPSVLLKSRKNEREIKHIKEAMINDGVALCEFFAWLEKALKSSAKSAESTLDSAKNKLDSAKGDFGAITEIDIDTQITVFRAKNPLYICNSFATIAGFNANGALPHYRASAEHFSEIKGDGLLLIDSGAQYQNGTTDITRVVGVGRASEAQKRDYTRTLKALIALSTATFPANTALPLLDSIARMPLWADGIEYMHGTGHGVGYFLNVHEAPVAISRFAPQNSQNTAQVGVISSIEPGIYREGKWGIRLENLVAIARAKTAESDFGEFLCFETLSLCPFERDLIDFDLLSGAEKAWLKAYHKKVFKALASRVSGEALAWLKQKTN